MVWYKRPIIEHMKNAIMDEERKRELGFLAKFSLPEIFEGAIRLFNLGTSDETVPYLNAFLDIAIDYMRSHPGDIHSFIDWWEDEGHEASLEADDQGGALKVLTIHKSKGLQYGYVFIPYALWKFDHESNQGPILWCNTRSPFQDFPVVPIQYGPRMIQSFFAGDYLEERLNSFVDNLNLLYVAFTRAEDGLYVFGPAADPSLKGVSGLIREICFGEHQPNGDILEREACWDREKQIFSIGSVPESTGKETGVESIKLESYPSWAGYSRLRLRYQDEDYVSDVRMGKIRKGTDLHELFETIHTVKDIDDAISGMIRRGRLKGVEQASFTRYLENLLQQPDVSEWFDGSWSVQNEVEILLPGGDRLRPDRLMFKEGKTILVDYKFGEQMMPSHRNQVRTYMKQLREMGQKEVRGFLWYVELEKVIAVEER